MLSHGNYSFRSIGAAALMAAALMAGWQPSSAAQTVSIAAVGDVMMARGVDTQCRKTNWDYPFANIRSYLHKADIAFGNLECPVSSGGGRMSRIITFRADPACLTAIQKAGFVALSVANNHAMDYGRTAFADTLAGLRKIDVTPIGGGDTYAAATNGQIIVRNGLRVGFLGFSSFPDVAGVFAPDQPSIGIMSDERLVKCVHDLKKRCDVVVVSCHWGVEGRTSHIPLQERLAHAAINAGASLVLGHHPHVAQDIETYQRGVIVYSMGNCVFDDRSRGGNAGLLFRCTLTRDGVSAYTANAITIHNCQPSIARVVSSSGPRK